MKNFERNWRLFVDPVRETSGLAVWANRETVRLEINREDCGLAVDFDPEAIAGLSRAVLTEQDGLAFGCVTDEMGLSLGGFGTAFIPTPGRSLDWLMHFNGEEATGSVAHTALDAFSAGLADAVVYARNPEHQGWRDLDYHVIGAAVAANELSLTVLTPLRRMSQAVGFVAEQNQRSA